MLTYEKIADLDRRGMREAAITAAMHAEARGRVAAAYEIWPFGKKYRERVARRQKISRDLSMLLSVPALAQFQRVTLHSVSPYTETRPMLAHTPAIGNA